MESGEFRLCGWLNMTLELAGDVRTPYRADTHALCHPERGEGSGGQGLSPPRMSRLCRGLAPMESGEFRRCGWLNMTLESASMNVCTYIHETAARRFFNRDVLQ